MWTTSGSSLHGQMFQKHLPNIDRLFWLPVHIEGTKDHQIATYPQYENVSVKKARLQINLSPQT